MKAPSICQIRTCCGELVQKGSNRLQCQNAQHHSAWLVESDGGNKWEFSTRGINFLKGKLVTQAPAASKASAEDERALVQLLDNPQKFEKKEARCISVLGVEILLETLCFLFFFVITDPPETSFLCPDVRCPFSSGGGRPYAGRLAWRSSA